MSKLAFLALVATIAVAACSSGSDEGAKTATDETTTETTVVEETPPPVQPGLAEDPDDVTGPLDLMSLSAVRTGDLLAVSLTTYERWDEDVLAGPRLDRPGPNRLVVAYDVDLDGKRDYVGEIVFAEGALTLVIEGLGQSFEPVPVERPDDRTAQFVHPADVLSLPTEGSDEDIHVAVTSVFEGTNDSAGPVLVPFAP